MVNRIFFASIGILVMVYVYKKVTKNKMLEKESFFWMIGSAGIFVISLFPQFIDFIATKLHIYYAPSMLFMLGIVFTLLLVFRLTIYVSLLQQQVKDLAQRNATLEYIVHGLEIEKER
ncbi:MAG: DUF2304 domain-containing protein [Clostridiales bacterium]|nr:DUF2304 domain-containing protein [Clostridiales bacterium]MDU6359631.1 DUF2304 domain-containing protein [Clostridiales bacterium]